MEGVEPNKLVAIREFSKSAKDSEVVRAYGGLIDESVRAFEKIKARQDFYDRIRQAQNVFRPRYLVVLELLAPDEEGKLGSYFAGLTVLVGEKEEVRYISFGPFWDLIGSRRGLGIDLVDRPVDSSLAPSVVDRLADLRGFLQSGDPIDGDTAYSAGPVLLIRWIEGRKEFQKLLCRTYECGSRSEIWNDNMLMGKRIRDFETRTKSLYDVICSLKP